MIRTALFLLILCSLRTTGQPQSPAERLEERLSQTAADTNRVQLHNELAAGYLTNQPEKSGSHAQAALQLARSLKYTRGEIVALNRLGEYEFRQSNYAQAVELATQSLKLAEETRSDVGMALAYRLLGLIHTFGFKQYDLALEYQLKALAIYENIGDKRNIAAFCGNITWIYANMNQNLEKAHELARLGIHLADSLGDLQLLSYNYNSQALIYKQEDKLDSALTNLDRSIWLAGQVGDQAVIAYDYSIKGQVYLLKAQFAEALKWFQQALKLSTTLNQREIIKDAYLGLTQCYEGLGDFARAYRHHLLYTQLKDSLVNWETSQKALAAKLEYEKAKKEARISELELANQQAKKEKFIYTVLFLVIIVSLIGGVALVLRNNRLRQVTNQLLQRKNEEIEAQNAQLKKANEIKDKLFSIIGHDLRSPLVSLKGLLGMAMKGDVSEKEFKKFAPRLDQQLISTNETLENLLQWSYSQMKGWTHHPAPLLLNDLVARCITPFLAAATEKQIEIDNQLEPHHGVHADKNQTELIFRNLLHNTIKFTNHGGKVIITASPHDPFLQIDIQDNGIGMSEEQAKKLFHDFSTTTTRGTQGERGTGLGALLAQEMAKTNGGYIKVTSKLGVGTTFHVFLPLADQSQLKHHTQVDPS